MYIILAYELSIGLFVTTNRFLAMQAARSYDNLEIPYDFYEQMKLF